MPEPHSPARGGIRLAREPGTSRPPCSVPSARGASPRSGSRLCRRVRADLRPRPPREYASTAGSLAFDSPWMRTGVERIPVEGSAARGLRPFRAPSACGRRHALPVNTLRSTMRNEGAAGRRGRECARSGIRTTPAASRTSAGCPVIGRVARCSGRRARSRDGGPRSATGLRRASASSFAIALRTCVGLSPAEESRLRSLVRVASAAGGVTSSRCVSVGIFSDCALTGTPRADHARIVTAAADGADEVGSGASLQHEAADTDVQRAQSKSAIAVGCVKMPAGAATAAGRDLDPQAAAWMSTRRGLLASICARASCPWPPARRSRRRRAPACPRSRSTSPDGRHVTHVIAATQAHPS